MGYSARDIIPRFEKFAGQRHGREPGKRPPFTRERFPDGSGSSLYYTTDFKNRVTGIQSYGSHFQLGILMLSPGGKRRRWLLNGDRWPGGGFGRTNEHNAMMREAAQKGGTPWFIVPFSAVREAGIDMATITPVDVALERFTWEDHSAWNLSEVPEGYRKHQAWYDQGGQQVPAPHAADGSEAWPDHEGGWHVWDRTALEGSAEVPVDGPEYEGRLDQHYEEITVSPDDAMYHWSEQRHWLGESVFRAAYTRWDRAGRLDTRHVRYFLAAFDEQEPQPLFFLAELPAGARPRTIAEAREALKPAQVAAAEQAGTEVLRQGDVFAIRSDLTTRQLKAPGTWACSTAAYVLGVNHTATEVITRGGDTYARGLLRHRPPGRAEHRTVVLGDRKSWWLLCKNTVPMVHGQSRAWSMGGRID